MRRMDRPRKIRPVIEKPSVREQGAAVGVERPPREHALTCHRCGAISRPGALRWRIVLDPCGRLVTYCAWCSILELDP
jgi:hypothetical protein